MLNIQAQLPISTVDIAVPKFMLGVGLEGEPKRIFINLRKQIDEFLNRDVYQNNSSEDRTLTSDMVSILDLIEEATMLLGMKQTMAPLEEAVHFLRLSLLSPKVTKLESLYHIFLIHYFFSPHSEIKFHHLDQRGIQCSAFDGYTDKEL